jgi:hypothetical protein
MPTSQSPEVCAQIRGVPACQNIPSLNRSGARGESENYNFSRIGAKADFRKDFLIVVLTLPREGKFPHAERKVYDLSQGC